MPRRIYLAPPTRLLRCGANLSSGIYLAPASPRLRYGANLPSGVCLAPALAPLRHILIAANGRLSEDAAGPSQPPPPAVVLLGQWWRGSQQSTWPAIAATSERQLPTGRLVAEHGAYMLMHFLLRTTRAVCPALFHPTGQTGFRLRSTCFDLTRKRGGRHAVHCVEWTD
jgi:hypothetical protein